MKLDFKKNLLKFQCAFQHKGKILFTAARKGTQHFKLGLQAATVVSLKMTSV